MRTLATLTSAAVTLTFALACATAGSTSRTTLQPAPCAAEVLAVPLFAKGGPVVAPKAERRVEPSVPASVRRNLSSASATVHAVVEVDGTVSRVCVVKADDPEWAAAVADSVRMWKFQPGTLDGKPTRVRFQLTSRFKSGM